MALCVCSVGRVENEFFAATIHYFWSDETTSGKSGGRNENEKVHQVMNFQFSVSNLGTKGFEL